ncbi:putative ankyrin repeat protein RF_0381 [Microplitis mediator]|uniref:putative ankyrin repeat protein RF_0381 n=1 Tax=Microplitis mediator TaxID=375433 RepID=UPI0025569623|nr:putative ankyrin repeat protein RF_0381 [Microplitis mediator]
MDIKIYREMRDKVKNGSVGVNETTSSPSNNKWLTSLQWAIKYYDYQFIEYLLNKKDILVNLSTEYYGTALHYAIDMANGDAVRKLVDAGADVNLKSRYRSYDIYPLDLALKKYRFRIAEFLIIRGANVNSSSILMSYKSKHLSMAVKQGCEDLIKLVVENSDNICENSEKYESLIIDAILCQNNRVLEYLLEKDIDPNTPSANSCNLTALHIAADVRNAKAVELLLNHDDIDVNRLSSHRNSVIDYAFFKDNFIICKNLLRAGIDFNKVKDHYFDNTRNGYDVISLIRQHIVKLNAAKMYNTTEKLNKFLNANEYANNFSKKCYEEIQLLKKSNVSKSSMSFYGILRKSVHEIARFLIYADIGDDDIIFNDKFLQFFM